MFSRMNISSSSGIMNISSSSDFEYNERLLNQLRDMGFSVDVCKQALYYTQNEGMGRALNWILDHMDDADFNEPFNPPGVKKNNLALKAYPGVIATNRDLKADPGAIATNRDLKADPEAIATTVATASTPVQADKALQPTLEFLTAENEDLRKQLKIEESRHASKEREWNRQRSTETRKLEDKMYLERTHFQLNLKYLTARNEDLQKQLKIQEFRHALKEREWDQQRAIIETRKLKDQIELLERANSQLKINDHDRAVDSTFGHTEEMGTDSPAAEASPVTASHRDESERTAGWNKIGNGSYVDGGGDKENKDVFPAVVSQRSSATGLPQISNFLPYDRIRADYLCGIKRPVQLAEEIAFQKRLVADRKADLAVLIKHSAWLHESCPIESKNVNYEKCFKGFVSAMEQENDRQSAILKQMEADYASICPDVDDGGDKGNKEMFPALVSQRSPTTGLAQISNFLPYGRIRTDDLCGMKQPAKEIAFRKRLLAKRKVVLAIFTEDSALLHGIWSTELNKVKYKYSLEGFMIGLEKEIDHQSAILKQMEADYALICTDVDAGGDKENKEMFPALVSQRSPSTGLAHFSSIPDYRIRLAEDPFWAQQDAFWAQKNAADAKFLAEWILPTDVRFKDISHEQRSDYLTQRSILLPKAADNAA